MDSTINLWSTRKSLRTRTPKSEVLNRVNSKLSTTIDLNCLTVPDLKRVEKSIGSKEPMPICSTKADYIKYLKTVIPGLKNAHRLSKTSLRQLSEEFDEKR